MRAKVSGTGGGGILAPLGFGCNAPVSGMGRGPLEATVSADFCGNIGHLAETAASLAGPAEALCGGWKDH